MTEAPQPADRWRGRGRTALVAAALTAVLLALDPASRTEFPVDAEATHVLLADSLLHDGDARYGPEDLRRAYRHWAGGPRGLRLAPVDGGRELGFGVPPLYALLTLPFRAALGRSGPLVANGLALFAAWLLLRRRLERSSAAWWLGAGVASAALIYAVLPQPQALLTPMVAVVGAGWIDRRGSPGELGPWAGSGLLLGLAVAMQPSLAVLAVALAADLAALRRWRELRTTLLATAGAWLVAMAAWGMLSAGGWGARAVRVYSGDYPFADAVAGATAESPPRPPMAAGRIAGSHPLTWQRLTVESWYWIAGRSGGLVVLFPAALVALLALAWRARGQPQLLLLATVLAVAATAIWARSTAVPGEAGTLGTRDFAAVFPLLLLATDRPPPRPLLVLGAAAAALWTLPALVAVLATGRPAEPFGGGPQSALALLPAELTRFADGERFGWTVVDRDGRIWVTPAHLTAPGGSRQRLWLRGDARFELWVVAPYPLDELAFTARARSEHGWLEVRSAGTCVRSRFDSADKRAGTPLTVPTAGRVSGLAEFSRREVFHRLTVATGSAIADPVGRGGALRYPGVLLDLDPDYRVAPRAVHRARREGGGSDVRRW